MPIRRSPSFAEPEGSQFCESGGVLFLPIRRGPIFANPEESQFCRTGGVPILPIRRGPVFTNPEGSYFCQSGVVLFLSIRRGPILTIRRGIVLSRIKKTTEKKVVKIIRLLRDRLGTSDCTGNLPFVKNQTKTKQN